MSLFVKQLKALRTTMSSVAPEHLNMGYWQCGTVACVCGHQAISGDLTHFTDANNYRDKSESIDTIADTVANDLDSACMSALGSECLSGSIWSSDTEARFMEAFTSAVLTPEQLQHPHLTTKSSPEDVVSYIDMILGVLNER
jgi:hypothetical protein